MNQLQEDRQSRDPCDCNVLAGGHIHGSEAFQPALSMATQPQGNHKYDGTSDLSLALMNRTLTIASQSYEIFIAANFSAQVRR
ncbi:hypothetical protein [Methylobacterium sp. GC_Met_2]|uniref:hypothetical protein n=1 Tax=Methylobacterium sp. GC_Met_2 TaxID=2937376 RepID=UPI00226B3CBB|nr:hypothetical protein [Methylobacterium sp. GC_Met_2]